MSPDEPAERARTRVLEAHGDVIEGVVGAAAVVASGWPDAETADRAAVVEPLSRELDRRGLRERFPAVIADAVAAAGYALQAQPVAAPPYAVVTSTGPVLRATVPAGRVVIGIRVFDVERDPVRYRLRSVDPADALSVEVAGGD